MAKTNKRNFSKFSFQDSKIVFKQWDEHKAGFENVENLMRSQNLSEEKSPIIAWSSDSECSSDSESTHNVSRIHCMQNHHVVTRLNFDDCVTRQSEVPNKKRAKVSRSVLKRNLFRNKSTLESNCKNELMKKCKVSRKIFFANKTDENVPMNVKDDGKFILMNTSHELLIAAEKDGMSIEQNQSFNTCPKGGMDLDDNPCLASETSFEEIKSSQLKGGSCNTNCPPNGTILEYSKIGNISSVCPHSPILFKTQLVERIQKSPIIGSSNLKKSIPSPILETYSVKKGRRNLRMKANASPLLLDTSTTSNDYVSHNHSSFKKSDTCNQLPIQKHCDRVEEKLVAECVNNSEINSEHYFQPCNGNGKFAPTSPIIDTKNQRLKRNKTKKKYRGQKNCLGPDFEVKVLENNKISSDTISLDNSNFCKENKLLDGIDPGAVKNCYEPKVNSNFEKLNLSIENCIINADESSSIYIETNSQHMGSENISFTQTSDSGAVTQNVCIETTKGCLIQDDEVCNISNFSGESKISDNETLNNINKTKIPEINVGKQHKSRKKSFIRKTYENSRSRSIVNIIQCPNEPIIECIETISSQESINQKDGDIDEDMSTSTSTSQNSKSSMNVNYKEYGTITVDSRSPQHQERVFLTGPMNLDSPRKRKRLKKDGLASRLHKLLSRKLSISRMLNHEISKQDTNHKINKTKSVLCTVIFKWMEFNHMLIYCQLKLSTDSISDETASLCPVETERWNGTLWNSDGECSNFNFLLVLNVDMYCFGQIKQGSVMKIFPPWQTFISSKQSLSVIFDITHLEIVSTGPLLEYSSTDSKKYHYVSEHEQTFSCQCDSDFDPKCHFKLSSNILKNFFPIQPSCEQTTNILCSMKDVGEKSDNSIVLAVKKNMLLPYADITLVLTIIKIFNYREQISKNSDLVEMWSILGKDRAGKYCEVILGSSSDIPSEAKLFKTTKWQNIILSGAVGNIYRFSGFTMINRKHRNKVPEVWSLLQNTKIINRTCSEEADVPVFTPNVNHMFLYIFAPATDNWNCECVKKSFSSFSDSLENLAFSFPEISGAEIRRFSAFMKLVHISKIYIYVSDLSPTDENVTYSMILIHPLCVLPNEILNKETDHLVIVDGIIFNGQLTTDKYSRIYSVISNADDQMILLSAEASNDMKPGTNKVQRVVGCITNSSHENDLVLVEGTVIGVDEETAFVWPACTTCNNDSLCELDDGTLFCNFCSRETEIFNKMSLEIFVGCKDFLPNTFVKIKLLQKTINYLLPPKSNNQGYEMTSILGKKIKLPLCLIVTIKNDETVKSIFLEEIELFERTSENMP